MPIVRERPRRSVAAAASGLKPTREASARMRSRVALATRCALSSLSARETVARSTPNRRPSSSMLNRLMTPPSTSFDGAGLRARAFELVAGVAYQCNRLTWRRPMLSVMLHTTRRRSPFVAPVDARACAKRRSVIASKRLHRDHADCAWSDFVELWLSGVSLETPPSDGLRPKRQSASLDRGLTRPD